ncbi:MAG: SirA family protein [Phenylobacterium zucineum]|nr:MAG: SirA family protein [Phenylobacterium zucineum]
MAEPVEIVIEARGHHCPVPTLRLRRAAEDAPNGATLILYADDPMAKIDVPHFIGQMGWKLLCREDLSLGFCFRIQKTASV